MSRLSDLYAWDCYILVISLERSIDLEISRKTISLKPGVYLYVGSSRGPGRGLSRVLRHLDRGKNTHWHIDHLTNTGASRITGFILIRSECSDCEEELTKLFKTRFPYIPRFGSSDKPRHVSHLFKCIDIDCIHNAYLEIGNVKCIREYIYVDTGVNEASRGGI